MTAQEIYQTRKRAVAQRQVAESQLAEKNQSIQGLQQTIALGHTIEDQTPGQLQQVLADNALEKVDEPNVYVMRMGSLIEVVTLAEGQPITIVEVITPSLPTPTPPKPVPAGGGGVKGLWSRFTAWAGSWSHTLLILWALGVTLYAVSNIHIPIHIPVVPPHPGPGPTPPPTPAMVGDHWAFYIYADADLAKTEVHDLRVSPTINAKLNALQCDWRTLSTTDEWVKKFNLQPVIDKAGGTPVLVIASKQDGTVIDTVKSPASEADIVGRVTTLRGK